jgi:hypothetical protein
MIKLLLSGILGVTAGVLVTAMLIKPTVQRRVDVLAEKSRPTMAEYKENRLNAMKSAEDDKAILERLISQGDDHLELVNLAKSKSKHTELITFAQQSAYTAALYMEQFGYAPSHGTGPHCDSVGC